MASLDKIKKIYERLENAGVSHLDPTRWPGLEPRSIRLTNFYALLAAGVSYSQSLIEFLQGTYFYAISDLIGGSLMLLTLAFSSLGFLDLSRTFILLVLNLDIYYFIMLTNYTIKLDLLFLVLSLFPLFLFTAKEVIPVLIVTIIPFAFYCITNFYSQINFIPLIYRQSPPQWYGIAVPIVAFGVSSAMIFRFLKINKEMHFKILRSAKFSSLGEMAAGISHEINNPLTSVVFNAYLAKELIRKGADSDSVIKKIESIETATGRAAKIVQGLRQFSRTSDEDPYTVFDSKRCIEETLSICHERFSIAGIKIITKIEDGVVFGNKTLISQILINLLNNTYDAVKNAADKWVRIEESRNNGWIEIRVIDSGPGIPKNLHGRIMEPFFSMKPIGEGTGLGLSISKGIAEAHHGELIFEPDAKNTTFTLRLPTAKNR